MTTPATSSRLNEVRSPKERRRQALVLVIEPGGASTKSAPHRSGDSGLTHAAEYMAQPRRSPLPTGAETSTGVKGTYRRTVPQRSPLPTGAETVRCHTPRTPVESPQRSPLPTGAETWAVIFTLMGNVWPQRSPLPTGAETVAVAVRVRSALMPQRSPLPTGAETEGTFGGDTLSAASTKSAPHRSGDLGRIETRRFARAPQRSPLPTGAETGGVFIPVDRLVMPQRSPLPTGAETGSARRSCSHPARLNEVRSPQQRRPRLFAEDRCSLAASTKSAPHRSGDRATNRQESPSGSPQRSPLPTGAETTPSASSAVVSTKPQRSPLPTGAETWLRCA